MKSIFWKYLTATIALLLISFGVFGASFLWQTYNLTLGESREVLEDRAEQLSEMTTLYLENNTDIMQQMYFIALSEVITEDNAKVLVCDTTGKVVYYLDENGLREDTENKVSEEAVSSVLNQGQYDGVGSFDGTPNELHYTCGRPVVTSAGKIVGALFVSAPATAALDILDDLHRIFLINGLIVLMIALIVSFFVTQSISKPLKKMTVATRAYAQGDFSVRLDESGDGEIGELAHSLNHMSESLEHVDQLRSSFIANVSHELKTPMTTIAGFVDGILDGTIPENRQREYLHIISNETRRLARLVVRMLEASRLQSGEVKMKPIKFDLCEMMIQTLIGFEQRIKTKKLDVDVRFDDDKINVMADQDNINQVVYNLIDNATKFSSDGGKLCLTISRTDKKVYVKVSNEGQTIAPNVLPHIFDRFYKADQSRGNDRMGAGLGLYLCKSILNMHGEDIHATSENGMTEFVFTLPLADL